MNAVPQPLVTIEQFFSWLSRQEGRFELVNGQVRMMTGGTYSHSRVKDNVNFALTLAARARGCESLSSDMGVRTGPHGIRYPDVVVACGPQSPKAMTAANPTILVEVSSPSTKASDLAVKLVEYQNLETVQIIMQIEPEEISVAVQRRTADGGWQVEIHQDLDGLIDLPPLGISLPVRDIYEGLDIDPRPSLQVVG